MILYFEGKVLYSNVFFYVYPYWRWFHLTGMIFQIDAYIYKDSAMFVVS